MLSRIALCVAVGFALCLPAWESSTWTQAVSAPADIKPKSKEDDPLTAWKFTWSQFQAAGALVLKEDLAGAEKLLTEARSKVSDPYSRQCGYVISQIRSHQRDTEREAGYSDKNPRWVAERNGRRLQRLGEICAQLHAYAEAAQLFEKAVLAAPHDSENARRQWCAALLELHASAEDCLKALSPRTPVTVTDWPAHDLKEFQDAKDDPQALLALIKFPAGLHGLHEVELLEPRLTSEELRIAVYWKRIELLFNMQDPRGAEAWEEKLLDDFPANLPLHRQTIASRAFRAERREVFDEHLKKFATLFPDAPGERADQCAGLLMARMSQLCETLEFDEALATLRRIRTEFPLAPVSSPTAFALARCFHQLRQFADATALYEKTFQAIERDEFEQIAREQAQQPRVDLDELLRDPTTDFDYSQYHYEASALSECYERIGKPAEALRWAILSHDKYRYRSFCGFGVAEMEEDYQARLTKLHFAIGKTEQALAETEAAMLQPRGASRWYAPWRRLFVKVIDDYRQRGKLDELHAKFAAVKAKNFADRQASLEKHPDLKKVKEYATYDGTSPAMQFTADYLRCSQWVDDGQFEKLWEELEPAKHRPVTIFKSWQGDVSKPYGCATVFVTRNPQRSVEFLRGKLAAGGHDRVWAAVLLAKIGRGVEMAQLKTWLAESLTTKMPAELIELEKKPDRPDDDRNGKRPPFDHEQFAYAVASASDFAFAMLLLDDKAAIKELKAMSSMESDRAYLCSVALREWYPTHGIGARWSD